MNIISWNINGLRAVHKKGALQNLIDTHAPDILLLQEIKGRPDQFPPELTQSLDWHQFYHPAQKPGYAGTGIWVKKSVVENPVFSTGMPGFDDSEGRIARVDFGDFTVLGVYFPNGGKSEEAWHGKIKFYEDFLVYVNSLREAGRKVIFGGDVNCAHEEIDLARPKDNMTSIGFLPEERDWITKVITHGWLDIFRTKYPNTVVYSWWHLVTRARERNVGWRIDYVFIDSALAKTAEDITYLTDIMGSDHCPVILRLS